jgi:hypothetical protein
MFPELVADRIARKLDLDVDDIGICHACLSFVSFAIDEGNVREIKRWTNRMTPDLWADGLEQPARLALRRAEEVRGARGSRAERRPQQCCEGDRPKTCPGSLGAGAGRPVPNGLPAVASRVALAWC